MINRFQHILENLIFCLHLRVFSRNTHFRQVPSARSSLVMLLFIMLVQTDPVSAAYQSRYITRLVYTDTDYLQEFNDNLRLPRQLAQMARRKNPATIEEEVLAKLDIIIEKIEVVLDMFPNNLKITVKLLEDSDSVSDVYLQNYGKKVNHIAYYSLSQDTIFISVDDTSLRVLSHEIGHAVVDHFFQVRPPYNIHELMAQFAEKHVTD